MFMKILSYIGCSVGLLVVIYTLSTALYTISNQLESHTRVTKVWITRLLFFIIVAHVLLYITENYSLYRTLWSLMNNMLYLEVMREFPQIEMTSVVFLAGCAASIVSHVLWFTYFTRAELPPYQIREVITNYKGHTLLPLSQLFSFFGLLIWSVPVLLFLCINVNEYALPLSTPGGQSSKYEDKPMRRTGLAKHVLERVVTFGRGRSKGSSGQELPL